MDCASSKGQGLVDADGHSIRRTFSIIDACALLAGEVRAICSERAVVERRFSIRSWACHDHVTMDMSEKQSGHGGQGCLGGWHLVSDHCSRLRCSFRMKVSCLTMPSVAEVVSLKWGLLRSSESEV